MSGEVTLQILTTQLRTGQIGAAEFAKQAKSIGANNTEIGNAILNMSNQSAGDVVEFDQNSTTTAVQKQESPDPNAAKMAEIKKQSAALSAHARQDTTDEIYNDAVNTVESGARSGMIERFKAEENTDKSKVRERFQNASKDYENAKKELKDLKEQFKAQNKKIADARKSGDTQKLKNVQQEADDLAKKLEEKQTEYNRLKAYHQAGKRRFLGINSGVKGYVKAHNRDAKNYESVNSVRNNKVLYQDKTTAEQAPAKEKEAIYLTDNEFEGLTKATENARTKLNEAKDALRKAEKSNSGDIPKLQEEVNVLQKRYVAAEKMFIKDAEGNSTGELDIGAVQDFIKTYTGSDERLNLEDEVHTLAEDMGFESKLFSTKNNKAREFVKKLGFGREHGTGQRLANAAIGAGVGSLSFLGVPKAVATATAVAQNVITNKVWHEISPEKGHFEEVDAGNGAIADKWVVDQEAKGEWVDKTEVKDGDAVTDKAKSKNLTGPFVTMLTSALVPALMTSPKTENAFNEGQIDAVLNNALIAKGNAAKGIAQEIIDLDLSSVTDDPVRAKAIKAAVIQTAIGGTKDGIANKEELASALAFLKYAQANPGILKPDEIPAEGPVTPPTPPTPPVTPKADDKKKPDLGVTSEETTEKIPYATWKYEFEGGKGKGGSLKDTVLNMYGVKPGTAAANKVWDEFLKVNPDFRKNRVIKRGAVFNVPNIKMGERTLKPNTKVKVKSTGINPNLRGRYQHTQVTYDSKTKLWYVCGMKNGKPDITDKRSYGFATKEAAEAKRDEMLKETE